MLTNTNKRALTYAKPLFSRSLALEERQRRVLKAGGIPSRKTERDGERERDAGIRGSGTPERPRSGAHSPLVGIHTNLLNELSLLPYPRALGTGQESKLISGAKRPHCVLRQNAKANFAH